MENKANKTNDHRILIAILWMLSGFILLVVVALLQFIVHFVLNSAGQAPVSSLATLIATAVNLFSALAAMVGVVLVPVGLIVGIIKLARH